MGFYIGDTVICSVEIKDSNGNYKDPGTSMKVEVLQSTPNYTVKVASTAMTKDSTGKYHYDCQTAGYTAGRYEVKYEAIDGTRITVKKDSWGLEP